MRLLLNILLLGLSIQLFSQVEVWNPQEVVCYPNTTTKAVPEMRETPTGLLQIRVLGEEQELPNLEIVSLYEDRRGSLWIGLMIGGLLRYNGHELEYFDSLDFFRTKTIMDIEEDSEGNLWFATFGNGLVKYDGKCFYHYSEASGFPGDHVLCLYRSPNGELYAGLNGEGIVELRKNGFRSSPFNNHLPGKKVWSILNDRSGATWVGLVDRGLYRFHDDSVKYWNTITEQALPDGTVRVLYEDVSGEVWAGTNKGVVSIESKNQQLELNQHPLLPEQVYDIVEIGNELWFGSNLRGVAVKNNEEIHYLAHAEGLVNLRVKCLLQSRMGNIWLGSMGGGIMRIDNYSFWNYYVDNGVPEAVRAIGQLPNGEILISPESGGIFIKSGLRFKQFNLPPDLKDLKCWDVLCQPDGAIWMATDGHGVIRLKDNHWKQWGVENSNNNRFLSLTCDKDDNIVAGGYQGLMVIGPDLQSESIVNSSLKGVEIWDLHTDSDGTVWIGTDGKGIWTIRGKELVQLNGDLNISTKAASDLVVTSITEDTNQNLIFALENDGVGFLQIRDPSMKIVIQKMPNFGSAGLYSVNSCNDGFIWLGTSKGILRFKDKTDLDSSEYFGRSDGIRSIQASSGKVFTDSKQRIWWATEKYLIEYDPQRNFEIVDVPQVFFEEVQFQNIHNSKWQEILPVTISDKPNFIKLLFGDFIFFDEINQWEQIPKGLALSHEKNKIRLKFTSNIWNTDQSSLYSYRLFPIEETWTTLESNEITFERLPPNEYHFQIRSRSKNGRCGMAKSIYFTIQPPFWKTFYFYIIVIIIGIFSFLQALRWRTSTLIREKKILEEKVQERTAELVAEKNKSDQLLLNILPAHTAEELKRQGSANTRNFAQASVLFSDFKGFTAHTEQTSPEKLIQTLDAYFIAFDDAASDFAIEKIKTIGDAYMCGSGIPISHPHHAVMITAFGLRMLNITSNINNSRLENGELPWNIRIGIHSGPLVAGVVGKKKYAYDIWGDTVNIASRMESSGEMNKLNISVQTKELVEDYFIVVERGVVAAKNKGMLEMFFVEGFKPPFADRANPYLPSQQFFSHFKINGHS